ncbi:MAG: hypothetical protein M3O15_07055, partial [Acidobacteriota bacterium]|nr:hypothetical protein [Acidobacteriota bacterium]
MSGPASPDEVARLYLLPGREKPVLEGHPWVFSGAVARQDGPRD